MNWLKIRKYIFGLTFLVVGGCVTEPIIFKGPYHVRFTEESAFARESFSKPINIEVHNAGPAPTEDVVVHYTISGSAREGVDYKILGTRGQVVIAKGKYAGNIQLQLINNANNILRSQDVIFTLSNVEDSNLEVGLGKSAIGKSFTFTIFDDCILNGYYIGKRGFAPSVEGITITSEDCERYLLSNWDVNIFDSAFDMDLTFIDKGDNTLLIPEQEEDSLPEDLATISGTGYVDPITRKINMTITLMDFDGAPQVSFTLTPD